MPITKEFENKLNNLNPSQKLAVETINGPLNIIANAGTGKTTVVALRCCNILQKTDFDPSNILCLTFSNAGVDSMKYKLHHLIGSTAEKIKVSTFHSFAVDILCMNDENSELTSKTLITPGQRMMILEKIINNADLAGAFFDIKPPSAKKLHSLHKIFNIFKKEYITKEDLISYCNHCLESILPYELEYLTQQGELNSIGRKLAIKIENFGRNISHMYASYQEILDEKLKFEFIDMLTEAIHILQHQPSILLKLQEQYQYIMVDEYQDTNNAMLVLISLLIKDVDQPNIAIVGDESQTIYRFQGANLKNYQWIENILPGMKTIVLDTNYRSTTPILNKSYEVISQSKEIHPLKKSPLRMGSLGLENWNNHEPFITSYEESEQEAYHTSLAIQELVKGLGEKDTIAVLARKNDDLKPIKKWLEFFSIPFDNMSLRGNLLSTLFGKANYYTLSTLKYWDKDEKLADAYFCNLLIEVGYKKEVGYAYLLHKHVKSTTNFITWLIGCADERIAVLQDVAVDLFHLQEVKYKSLSDEINNQLFSFIIKITKQAPALWLTMAWEDFVEQFKKTDKNKSLESLCELLDYYHYYNLSIDFEDKTPVSSQVILTTIHGSKGLEYDHVFVIGLESENFENKRDVYDSINIPKILNRFINTDAEDIEDYRRLLYVAMTRAKKTLQLSYRRKSYSGKEQKLSILLQCLVDSGSLKLVHQDIAVLPKKEVEKNEIELDEDFKLLVTEKLNEFHISASSTNNWEQCQNKFFYYNICKIPSLPSVPTTFGSLVHAVLHKITSGNTPHIARHQVSEIVEEVFITYQHVFHPLHRFNYKRYATELVFNFLSENPIERYPHRTEEYLTATLENGVRINGFLDRIDLDQFGFEIIDYKTNKYDEKLVHFVDADHPGSLYWRQGKLYTMLVKHNYTDTENVTMSFYYLTKKKKVPFVDYANDFENWLLNIWNDIHALRFKKNCDDTTCVYCTHNN